jgi:hypothetical protein
MRAGLYAFPFARTACAGTAAVRLPRHAAASSYTAVCTRLINSADSAPHAAPRTAAGLCAHFAAFAVAGLLRGAAQFGSSSLLANRF